MKRRDLLKTLALGPVAALLPALPAPIIIRELTGELVVLDEFAYAAARIAPIPPAPLYLRQFLRYAHVALYYGGHRIDCSDLDLGEYSDVDGSP